MDAFDPIPNPSFSTKNPMLQLYLDSTSLNEFKICPRRYFYSIVMGYQPAEQSVHLTFGILMHQAVEHYWLFRLKEHLDHLDALRNVVREVMKATWDYEKGRPWQSEVKTKNRFTLVRTIVWYLDKYQNDPIQTVVLPGEKVAVELPFQLPVENWQTEQGEEFILCGKMDRLGELNKNRYVTDVKTTQRPINSAWYSKFSPDNQFSLYSIAAKVIFGTEVLGILVDGIQVVQTFSEFHRGIVERTPEQLERWLHDLRFFLAQLEWCATNNEWPLNDSNCNLWGGCPFRGPCAAQTKNIREMLLKNDYKRRVWDARFLPM